MPDIAASGFIAGHATHPDGRLALALAAAQIDAQLQARRGAGRAFAPSLALLYLTDRLVDQAEAVLADARQRWPGVTIAGCIGVGVAASGTEYFDEPAISLLMLDLPAGAFRPFSGRQALPGDGSVAAALVHADPATPDIDQLVADTDARLAGGYAFGGLLSSRGAHRHWVDQAFEGGLSGIAFDPSVHLVSRVTQGCQPIGMARRITRAERNLVLELDGRSALQALLDDAALSLDRPREAVATLRATLAGNTDARDEPLARGGQFGTDTRVRHIVGVDPARGGVAIADLAEPGQQLAWCRRDRDAARRDLVRICAEVRDAFESDEIRGPTPIAGALYISCTGRGGPHFGAPHAELQIVRHALGEVPLAGFFAAGEIARRHLYGYTGVLVAFGR